MEFPLRVKRKIATMLLLVIIITVILTYIVGHVFIDLEIWLFVPILGAIVSGFLGFKIIRRNSTIKLSFVQSAIVFIAIPILGFVFFMIIVQLFFLLLFILDIYRG